MYGHVIHALFGLFLDYFKHYISIEVFNPFDPRDRFVNRHRADGNRRVAQNGFANLVNITASGKIHHGVGAIVNRGVQFF